MWIFVIQLFLYSTNCIFRPDGKQINAFGKKILKKTIIRDSSNDSLSVSLSNEIADLQDGFPVGL